MNNQKMRQTEQRGVQDVGMSADSQHTVDSLMNVSVLDELNIELHLQLVKEITRSLIRFFGHITRQQRNGNSNRGEDRRTKI